MDLTNRNLSISKTLNEPSGSYTHRSQLKALEEANRRLTED